MKSEITSDLFKEYLEGDEAAEEALFARYERDVEVPPDLWAGIEEQIIPAPASSFAWWLRIAAVLLLTIGLAISYIYLRSESKHETAANKIDVPAPPAVPDVEQAEVKPGEGFKKPRKPITRDNRLARGKRLTPDNPGVLSTDLAYLDIDEQDTVKHIEQTENLLRSIRNFTISDTDEEIDVSYDKALSRRLLIENVVLRREAEMKAKFPTKTLLADLEPFLIDIANLPDQAKPEEVRAIKERVQKTEIVAALLDYQDRSPNNR
ncbi:MAG TPA: hypothetical protein VFY34_12670 [Pyrinomonadaceae bacterium]|nr:hypothetical protein [Pyrinomonadaceae bacterium]